jgi:cysteine desulfurase family protein (TIGR01976 family)
LDTAAYLLTALGLATFGALGAFAVTSLREGEQRAGRLAFGLAIALSLPFFLSLMLPSPVGLALLGLAAIAILSGLILFLLPIGRVELGNDVPTRRFDERDIMFARARLEPGSPNYLAYYAMRPEHRTGDDRTRDLPGLLSAQASQADPAVFAATQATFDLIEALRPTVDGPLAQEPVEAHAEPSTTLIKGLARYWGARTVGVAELKPYHIYTHVGRGSGEYGAPVSLDHRYAIAFTVEMDRALVTTAPAAPTLMESARQYANAAHIAVQLGAFIRSLGYPARAHIDGNYRVIAPLVARDAGLGEIGRMGLLMTPMLGPRVRLGVVTTDLPLVPDQRRVDPSVLDFCRVCTKCAQACPVRAIPFTDRAEIDGALRWRLDDAICFRYWNVTGTDCARCMAVCPYSYPDSPLHNLVRWAAHRSGAARRAVIWLDNLFYGSAPPPRAAPSWLPARPPQGRSSATHDLAVQKTQQEHHMALNETSVSTLRSEFPALQQTAGGRPLIFFDGPGGTQVHGSVIEAMRHYLTEANSNFHGAFLYSRRTDETVDAAHRALADLLNASRPEETVFGPNMTSLTFNLSRAIGRTLVPGDEIVVTRLDHDANIAPWLSLQERGVVIRHADLNPSDCTLDWASLEAAITSRTRLVALGYASNAVGTINDVTRAVELAHAVGAWVYVDAVHYAPHGPIDVQALGCDFLVCSVYKFFGPHLGALYGRYELLESLPAYKVRPAGDAPPFKFETGTQSFEALAGATAAVDYLASVGRRYGQEFAGQFPGFEGRRLELKAGMAAIRAYERDLCQNLVTGLDGIPGLRIYGITDPARFHQRVPTVSFTLEGVAPREIARRLDGANIFAWNGHFYALAVTERLGLEERGGLLRVGLAHYNTAQEIDVFLGVLADMPR